MSRSPSRVMRGQGACVNTVGMTPINATTVALHDRWPTINPWADRCRHCHAPMALDIHPHDHAGEGGRAYTCGLCGKVTVFYSAAWLSDRA